MAFFDPEHRTITVRIVYDGLGTAGKTTNVQQIHALYTLNRRGDIYVPEEHKGRTLFFDWLELEAGLLDDYRLRCQLLTVPGQFAYAQRRWQLLQTPDAIVQVCDSSPAGVNRSRYAVRFLREMLKAQDCPDVPVIVQANKQDIAGALSGERLAEALGLDAETRVVEAVASTGEGVRATLIFALQAARDSTRKAILERGLDALPRDVESAEEVYSRMREIDDAADAQQGLELAELIMQPSS